MIRQMACVGAVLALAGACGKPADVAPQAAAPLPGQAPAVVAPAAPAAPAPVQSADGGPPLVDGFYVQPGACPGEGCQLGAWVATAPGDLRQTSDQSAPVTLHVAKDEKVEAVGSILRLKPVRGVVTRAGQELAVGDVVYLLDGEGEGFFSLWTKGALRTWSWPDDAAATVDETTGIKWDRPEADWANKTPTDPREGWWVQIRTASGATGWTRDRGYECRPVETDPGHCQLQ